MKGDREKSAPDSAARHAELSRRIGPVPIAIVTVSDSRIADTDRNGSYLRDRAEAAGHTITAYTIIRDEARAVEETLERLARSDARLIFFNGGTGIAPRDTTIDVVIRKLDKELAGFGEIFRMLSYEEVGSAAILSRATAGVYKGKVVVCTPGSPAAVRLAWEKLIAPELEHLVWEAGGRRR